MSRSTRLQVQPLEGREVPADLTFAFALSGLSPTGVTRIAADPVGNVYVAGTYTGTIDLDPSTTTAYNLVGKGGTDVFVAKYSATGQIMWAKTLDGAANETIADVVVDGIGNVYVAGTFSGAVDFNPDPNVSSTLTAAPGGSAFLWKLSQGGNFFMARSIGGTSTATGLVVNPSGQIMVTGQFTGTADFNPSPTASANLITTNPAGSSYIWRLDVLGNYVYAKPFNTTGTIETAAITMDGLGNAFIAGRFTGTADLDPADGTKANYAAGTTWMPFVDKLGPTGAYLWGRTLRTVTPVAGAANSMTGLGVDAMGNVYTSGTFAGTVDFDPGALTLPLSSNGGSADGFAWKLDPSGAVRYANRFGGPSAETVSEMGIDSSGMVSIGGTFTGIGDFDPNPSLGAVANLVSGSGAADTYVVRFGPQGAMKYTRALGGGTSTARLSGLFADGAGNMYVTGGLAGKGDFDPGPAVSTLAGGAGSAFVAKLSPSLLSSMKPLNTPPINRTAGGPYTINEGDGLTLKASASDLDLGDLLAYTWDLNGDGTFGDATGARPTLTGAQMKALGLNDGTGTPQTIKVRISDGVNLPVEASATLTIQNLPPTAQIAVPATIVEGVRPTITVTPTDPSTADTKAGIHYSYDFNDDGVWDLGDGTSYAGSVTTGAVKVPATWVADSGPLAIRVRVFDKDGGKGETSKTIEITNIDPTATFGTTAPAVVGAPVTFKFSDPKDAPTDQATGFTYGFDFDNDGVFEVMGTNPKATRTFAVAGTYIVRGSITDQDGGTTIYTLTVNVTPF